MLHQHKLTAMHKTAGWQFTVCERESARERDEQSTMYTIWVGNEVFVDFVPIVFSYQKNGNWQFLFLNNIK